MTRGNLIQATASGLGLRVAIFTAQPLLLGERKVSAAPRLHPGQPTAVDIGRTAPGNYGYSMAPINLTISAVFGTSIPQTAIGHGCRDRRTDKPTIVYMELRA